MKLLKYVLTITAIVAIFVLSSRAEYDKHFYDPLMNAPLEELLDKGRNLIVSHPDSALAYFSVCINRYSPSLSKEDQITCVRAMNNAGYLYFFEYNDLSRSYSILLKAVEIENKLNDEEVVSALYLNIANLFISIDEYYRAAEYYKKSIDASLRGEEWDIYVTATIGYFFQAYDHGHLQSINNELNEFFRQEIPDNIAMCNFARNLFYALIAIENKEYDTANEYLRYSLNCIDTPYTPERNKMIIKYLQSKVATLQGDKEKAVNIMTSHYPVMSQEQILSTYGWFVDLYSMFNQPDSVNKYKILYYEGMESTRNNHNDITKIEHSFSIHRMEENIQQLTRESESKSIRLLFSTILSCILLAFALFIWYSNRKLKQSKEDLFRKNQELIKNASIYATKEISKSNIISTNTHHVCQEDDTIVTETNIKLIELAQQLSAIMEQSDVIYETEFSIEKLAEMANSHTKFVSKAINDIHGKNFNTFLQDYRIREACCRLSNIEKYGHLTIESIALDLGFKSRTNFISVFKRHTGLTPSEFQRIAKEQIKH